MKIKIIPSGGLFGNKKQRRIKHPESRFMVALIPMIWMIIFFVAPMFIITKISFSESLFAMPPFSKVFNSIGNYLIEIKINLRNYVNIIQDSYYVTAFFNSIALSLTATALCFLLGFPMAYGIHNASARIKPILLLLVSLSFWTSFLIRIYSWMNLLSVQGIVNSLLMNWGIIDSPIHFLGNYYVVCLGLVFCYLPFMIFPVYAVLEKVDKSYIESAYDLGCRQIKTFWTITIPLTYSGILSGCILVFATTTGEFVIPELLGGASTITFGRVLWNEFFTNLDWPMACALSITMMLFIILPIFFLQKKAKL